MSINILNFNNACQKTHATNTLHENDYHLLVDITEDPRHHYMIMIII